MTTTSSDLFSTFADEAIFSSFYSRLKDRPKCVDLPHTLIGLDPGGTTGVGIFGFEGPRLREAFQLNTSTIYQGVKELNQLLTKHKTKLPHTNGVWVVMEDYRVYSWKTKQHAWASLHTPRLLGVIECLCYQHNIPLYRQSAQVGKGFMGDERLKEFGYWFEGRQHARDAIRHGCQFLLFHKFTDDELAGTIDPRANQIS